MDKGKQYLQMLLKSPRELTQKKSGKHLIQEDDCVYYCALHNKFTREDYSATLQCDGMEKAIMRWKSKQGAWGGGHPYPSKEFTKWDKENERKWRQFQKTDDWCEDKHWIKVLRQEDLQKMVLENYTSPRKMFVHFGQWCAECGDIHASGEQHWLAFVQHIKYQKQWNGKDWVNEPE